MADNWQLIRNDLTKVEYYRLTVGRFGQLEIMQHYKSGAFLLTRGGIDIGKADTLEAAKEIAKNWVLERVAEMLEAVGAEGVWLVRGAKEAVLRWQYSALEQWDILNEELWLEKPHELILVARFPAGDGGEAGIASQP